MKITLDLPEHTVDPSDGYNDPYYDPGVCGNCGYEKSGTMAKLVPYGWVHTEPPHEGEKSCLQAIVDNLPQIGASAAWLVVGQHVARYPSRHSASTIRSVITELLKPAWKVRKEAGR
ncbi:hypothetical protein AB0G67_40240 [Streptomyces sp. NPDC021056]|uniref:hypothetical protein n=1 Tax=Streptomyces sp. NPDC021056 TaxID=3155012 RepID=UPI0033EA6D54